MKTNYDQIDLCATCENARSCTFPRNFFSPVMQCEEFLADSVPPPRFQSDVFSKFQTKQRVSGENAFHGLCVNCELRKTCTFPKTEAGIWHCEEFE